MLDILFRVGSFSLLLSCVHGQPLPYSLSPALTVSIGNTENGDDSRVVFEITFPKMRKWYVSVSGLCMITIHPFETKRNSIR